MKIIDCKQYDRRWWEVRRGVPSASEFSNIITPAKGEYSTASSNYACQLVADYYDSFYGMQEEYVSVAMRNGTEMEPRVRKFYEFHRDCGVTEVGFCLSDDGRFGCSPDGLVGEEGGTEIKSPKLSTQIKYLDKGVLPPEYKPQVHACLWITGREWWDFLSYAPGLPELLIRVTPDDYTKRLAECADKFWEEYQSLKKKIADRRELAIDERIAATEVEESYF